ncbi:hypothetical protein B0H10DRAFT_2003779 [Mycena sp. CBHHK59/15]|nr:hypothetical protein B0H10DRAFT_2003779 [Mycena sp. CBHHK59/15]
MRGCPELRKLPKATGISSLHFRRQTPGSTSTIAWLGVPHANKRLDPHHPLDRTPGTEKGTVWAKAGPFILGAIPMGLLHKPDLSLFPEPFDSWADRVARGAPTGSVAPMRLNDPRPNRISMSLQLLSNRNATHVRVQILRRFKTALNLIVTRGADAKDVKGRLQLVFDEENDPYRWILQGWTYTLRAQLDLYQLPYPELVQRLRPALRTIWFRGTWMEEQWAAATVPEHQPHRLPTTANPRMVHETPEHQNAPRERKTILPDSRVSKPATARGSFGLRRLGPDDAPPAASKMVLPDNATTRRPFGPGDAPSIARKMTLPDSRVTPSTAARRSFGVRPLGPDGAPRAVRTPSDNHEASAFDRRRPEVADPSVPANFDPFPDFDPFPSTPRPRTTSTSDSFVPMGNDVPESYPSQSARRPSEPLPTTPPPDLLLSNKPSKPDWWAIGRKMEAGVGLQYTEGSRNTKTKWDRSPNTAESSPPSEESSVPPRRRAQTDAFPQEHAQGRAQATPQHASSALPEGSPPVQGVRDRLAKMLERKTTVFRPDRVMRATKQLPWHVSKLEDRGDK